MIFWTNAKAKSKKIRSGNINGWKSVDGIPRKRYNKKWWNRNTSNFCWCYCWQSCQNKNIIISWWSNLDLFYWANDDERCVSLNQAIYDDSLGKIDANKWTIFVFMQHVSSRMYLHAKGRQNALTAIYSWSFFSRNKIQTILFCLKWKCLFAFFRNIFFLFI